jgi:hypothetical protein
MIRCVPANHGEVYQCRSVVKNRQRESGWVSWCLGWGVEGAVLGVLGAVVLGVVLAAVLGAVVRGTAGVVRGALDGDAPHPASRSAAAATAYGIGLTRPSLRRATVVPWRSCTI